jgi:hypothetical protein
LLTRGDARHFATVPSPVAGDTATGSAPPRLTRAAACEPSATPARVSAVSPH